MKYIYGTFKKVTGFDAASHLPIENTYRIIGTTQVSGYFYKQLAVECYGKYETLTELPEGIEWSKDFKGLNIQSIDDLAFEIKNKENREKYPNYRRAIISFQDKTSFVGLITSKTIDLINNGLRMITVVNGETKYYVNADKMLTLEFLDRGNKIWKK